MNNNEQKLKYIPYHRKSSEAEDRQALSIPGQKEETDSIIIREKLDIYNEYSEAKSAKKLGRPFFNQMVNDIETGKANAILAWHANRLSRNPIDSAKIISLMDDGKLIEVKTPTYTFRDIPMDKFWLAFQFSQAKLENDNKGVDVKRTLYRKADEGWLPGVAPIGYINIGSEKGFKTIAKDPDRFELLRMAWNLLLSGNSVRKIREILNNDYGFRTRQFKKQGNKPISMSMLYKMFSDPFYYCYFEYPKGSGNWHHGQHEQMVSEDEFKKAQIILGNKLKAAPKTKIFAYTGLMRCGHDGGQITAEEKFKKQKNGNIHHYIYYRCTKKKDFNCPEKYVEVKELEKQISALLSQVEIDGDFKDWAIRQLNEIHKKEINSVQSSIATTQKNYDLVLRKLDNLTQLKISPNNSDSSLLSDNEYKEQKNKLIKEKEIFEGAMRSNGNNFNQVLEMSEKAFDFALHAHYWFENGDLDAKRNILSSLGSNLIIKDQKLSIDLQKPFFLIKNYNLTTKSNNGRLEPLKTRINKRKTSVFDAGVPTLLRGQDSNLEPSPYT